MGFFRNLSKTLLSPIWNTCSLFLEFFCDSFGSPLGYFRTSSGIILEFIGNTFELPLGCLRISPEIIPSSLYYSSGLFQEFFWTLWIFRIPSGILSNSLWNCIELTLRFFRIRSGILQDFLWTNSELPMGFFQTQRLFWTSFGILPYSSDILSNHLWDTSGLFL